MRSARRVWRTWLVPPCRAALVARSADAANSAAFNQASRRCRVCGRKEQRLGEGRGGEEGEEFGHMRKGRSVRMWPRRVC